MKKLLLLALVLITLSVQAQTPSKSYTATLKKYMEITGSMKVFKTVITSMMNQFKTTYPNVPAEWWNEFEAELMTTSIDDLCELIAPVYEKHLTESDLKKIIKFYDSEVGRKLAAETPEIMQESMAVGRAWGAKIGDKVLTKMKEKGYK